ncbi:MAG: hypothetical protein K6F56_02095 [Oscillospiraceae bacterium]|nr:hypothetical protein [Oscillospiraceae bacterium]
MIDVYRSIGLQRLTEDPALLDRLKRFVADNCKSVAPGYAIDYFEHVFPQYVEFRVGKDRRGQVVCTNMHLSSSNCMLLVLDRVLSEGADVHMYEMHVKGGSFSFPVRYILPDLLADPQPGDEIACQVVAFAGDDFHVCEPGEDSEKSLSLNGSGDLVISGEVTKVKSYAFDFEDLRSAFQTIDVETALGPLSLACTGKHCPDPPVGQWISTDCVISACPLFGAMPFYWKEQRSVPGIPSYKGCLPDYPAKIAGGFIPSRENDLRVFKRCAREGSFKRFERCCFPVLSFSAAGKKTVCSRRRVLLLLAEVLGIERLDVRDTHILSCPDPFWNGQEGLLVCANKAEKAVVCLWSDSDGFVEQIEVLDPAACVLAREHSVHALVTVCKSMGNPDAGFPGCAISEECCYYSDLADYRAVGPERILRHFKGVVEPKPNSVVRYELARIADMLREGRALPFDCSGGWCAKIFVDERLDGVLFVQTDADGRICNIFYSHDGYYLKDFPESGPKASCPEGCLDAKALLEQKYGETDALGKMRLDAAPASEEICRWIAADQYARHVLQEPIEQDFLGDKYIRYYSSFEGEPCVLYLFLQKDKLSDSISESFAWLRDDPGSRGRRILILYVRAFRNTYGDYAIGHYLDGRHAPELWTLENVAGRELLMYASEIRQSIRMDRFGAAFNARDYGLLCALSTQEARKEAVGSIWLGAGMDDPCKFFETLYLVNGPLKPGYVRTDRTAFRKVLCSGDKLCIALKYDADGIISKIWILQQDESYHELIVLDEVCPPHPPNAYPRLAHIRALPPSGSARFCMRLDFDNGEEKVYQFKCTGENDEIAMIEGYCFTDRIFQNGRIVESDKETAKKKSNAEFSRGQRIEFANGFSVSAAELYFESEGINTSLPDI